MQQKTLLEFWHEAKSIQREIREHGEPEYPSSIGFVDLYTGGFHKGEIWIIAGKTGIGKTALAIQLARSFAENPKHKILFLSLEMRGWELLLRMFSEMMEVSYTELILGRIDIDEVKEKAYKEFIGNINFEIVEHGYTFADVEKIISSYYKSYKPDVIFLDFIQLIEWKTMKDERLAIMEYIRKIKEWANQFNIGFVVVSQLRRLPSGADYNRPPDLIDLKGSGSLEQCADKVFFIYSKTTIEEKRYFINLAKNRQGRTHEEEVIFEGEFYRFRDYYVSDEIKKAQSSFRAEKV